MAEVLTEESTSHTVCTTVENQTQDVQTHARECLGDAPKVLTRYPLRIQYKLWVGDLSCRNGIHLTCMDAHVIVGNASMIVRQ